MESYKKIQIIKQNNETFGKVLKLKKKERNLDRAFDEPILFASIHVIRVQQLKEKIAFKFKGSKTGLKYFIHAKYKLVSLANERSSLFRFTSAHLLCRIAQHNITVILINCYDKIRRRSTNGNITYYVVQH